MGYLKLKCFLKKSSAKHSKLLIEKVNNRFGVTKHKESNTQNLQINSSKDQPVHKNTFILVWWVIRWLSNFSNNKHCILKTLIATKMVWFNISHKGMYKRNQALSPLIREFMRVIKSKCFHMNLFHIIH
jgi:hypothetical protein